ncbi:AAA family ATPase [Bacillus paranthracis]|uniref:AAA family ATPase n=1 Tax=Bacillus paranthracis TaxID=2026186 RepID=UPI003557E2FD
MEILFVWIGNYKNINNQGFNFGGELLFRFESGKLIVSRNHLHIPGFFDIFPQELETSTPRAEILNVTGIAGENGTGKSNVLDFLKNLSTYEHEDYLLCFKKDNRYYLAGTECAIELPSEMKIERINKTDAFSSCRFVYLSNIFDITRTEETTESLFNISTNFLIREEGMEGFRANEFLRQITFSLNKKLSALIDFKLPEKIICRINNSVTDQSFNELLGNELNKLVKYIQNRNAQEDDFEFEKNLKLVKKIRGVLQQVLIQQKDDNFYFRFLYHIFTVYLHEVTALPKVLAIFLIKQIYYFEELVLYLTKCLRDKTTIVIRQVEEHVLVGFHKIHNSFQNEFSDLFLKFSKRESLNIRKFKNRWLRATSAKITTIERFTDIFEESSRTNEYINIQYTDPNLQEFIQYYSISFMKTGYLQFEWTELSAGQVALLNIYSRLHYAMKKTPKKFKEIIIIIDEGELYFHPEWQRKWLWYILNVVSTIFHDKQVQIIQSTHSPFVLSDLPNHNVIFLKKDNNGDARVIEGLEDNQLTFAANIHMLLSNSFFMENGLVGEVAKTKINQLIKELQTKNSKEINRNKDEITKQLRYIGEPIVRNKLFSMLSDILTIDYLQVQQRLENIEGILERRGIK